MHFVSFLSKAGTPGAACKQRNPACRFFKKSQDTGIPKPPTDF